MDLPCLPAVLLVLALLALGVVGLAQDEPAAPQRPALVDHPLKDARPGEFLRYVEESDGWKKWYVERVLDVREGEVLLEVFQTNEEGQDRGAVRAGWMRVPELKVASHQRVLKDEMVEIEVAGQKLWCRHLYIEERIDPLAPDRVRRKDVWYTNDLPCTGKARDTLTNREVLAWGMLGEADLKARLEAWRKAESERAPR